MGTRQKNWCGALGAGHMLANYAGLQRMPTGLAMVAIDAALVPLTIALGG